MVKSARSSHRILRSARDCSRRREIFFGTFRAASSDSEHARENIAATEPAPLELQTDPDDDRVRVQSWS